ncbi:MAG: hypothetical protein IPH10_11220 [bacterium]|nr:hypothetical protein [bacterium]
MHSFIHPLQAAVPIVLGTAKTESHIFARSSKATSKLAERYLPDPTEDVVTAPLAHDTPAEIAQPSIKDWSRGECGSDPRKTMPIIKVVTRDYKNVFNKFISLGPTSARPSACMVNEMEVADMYDAYMENNFH